MARKSDWDTWDMESKAASKEHMEHKALDRPDNSGRNSGSAHNSDKRVVEGRQRSFDCFDS